MYWLYLKTSPYGLKYLGKFTSRKGRPNFTVYEYMGSGKIWKQHIQKHQLTSKDIHTQVLLETDSLEKLQKVALKYSREFAVEESKTFANLVPEDGANPCKYVDFSKRNTPEWRKKLSERKKGIKKSKEHIDKIVESKKRNGVEAWNKGIKNPYKRSKETKHKMSQSHKEYQLNEFKKKLDPIIENIILDSSKLFGKQLQKKYNLSYEQLRKAKLIYRFECKSGTRKKHRS